jgi:outer membrane lipoprotein-sorting protein
MKPVVKTVLMCLCLQLLALNAPACWGQDAPKTAEGSFTAAEVTARIQAKARSLKNLGGHFRQLKLTRFLVSPMESQGTFQWQPPEHFRWEVTQPAPFRLVAKGDAVLILYPDLNRARRYRHPMGGGLLGQITGTAGDADAFERSYNLQVVPAEGDAPELKALIHFRMEPKSSKQSRYLKRIEIFIDPGVWLPRQIEIWEANDDKTTILLSDLVENGPMPESIFSVEAPDGVEMNETQSGGQR